MRRSFSRALLALVPLILAACGKPDLDVPLSDEHSSILDTRLIGIWQIVQPTEDKAAGCFVVGKKQGSNNTLEATMVGIGDDLSVGSHRLNIFACGGEHNYLSITSDPPDKGALGQWLLARYEFAADGTVRVRTLKYDVFHALVRQEIARGNLKGTIEGRRRRGDWVFALPGREREQLHFADSGAALVALLDAHPEECFESTALVFKRLETGGKLRGDKITVPPVKRPLPAIAANAASRPPKSNAKEAPPDDWAPQLPQSFEVAAAFHRPAEYAAGKLEAFRSVALRVPWVYALDRTGTLCIFRTDAKPAALPDPARDAISPLGLPAIPPTARVENVGDGGDLKIFGNVLVCSDSGGIKTYNLDVPNKPRLIGRFGPTQKRSCALSIVRQGKIAYLVGDRILQTYDLTRPERPTHVGSFDLKRFAIGGSAAGHCLYLAVFGKGGNGIATFNISDPARPVEASFTPTSQTAYALFATPDGRLIASLDADDGWHMVSESYITVAGYSALYGLTDPEHPKLLKTYGQSGGRTSALSCVDGRCFFICHGVVFAVNKEGLEPDSAFFPEGSTMDGLAYHGDADGNYAALTADSAVIVLRRKVGK
jgi:hypothetical protein